MATDKPANAQGPKRPDRYLHGALHPNGECPNGVCAVFGVPRDAEADDRLRADLAAITEAEREAMRRG